MVHNAGLLLVFSGPSGTGKGTVLKELLNKNHNIKLSVSATTRQPRAGECDGVHYFFMTNEEFEQQITDGNMLEYAQYCGKYYGTPSVPIQNWLANGMDVALEIEVQGARQIKEKCPDCISIFVLPPSLKELEKRLRIRNTEDEETIQKRLKIAQEEIITAKDYDYVVVNDTVSHTVQQIHQIIAAEKLRISRAGSTIERVLKHDSTKY